MIYNKLNTTDFLWWSDFRDSINGRLNNDEYKMVCEIHARSFNKPLEYVTKCSSCGKVQGLIDDLNKLYLEKL